MHGRAGPPCSMAIAPVELLRGSALASAFVAGVMGSRATSRRRRAGGRLPALTLCCASVIGAVSLAQLTLAPSLLPLLMRDAAQVHAGQVWRLATSLLVQDGGWAGAAFNLVGLLAIGALAERLLGRRRWGVVAVVSVLCAQWLALSWQPTGGGNSILNFGLAGAVCAACLTARPPQGMAPAVAASACFVALLAMEDIHGAAAVTGALVAAALASSGRNPTAPNP